MIALLLVGVEIIVANELAGLGKNLVRVEASIAKELAINESLSTKVASSSSLLAVGEKAKELGFREPTKNQRLTLNPAELPVALEHSVR